MTPFWFYFVLAAFVLGVVFGIFLTVLYLWINRDE